MHLEAEICHRSDSDDEVVATSWITTSCDGSGYPDS
jgi:hypothetical protein